MGYPEQPITRKMLYGGLRHYECRQCGRVFKDYCLPEEKRVCPRCLAKQNGEVGQ